MQAEVPQPNTARRWPTAAVFSAMDMKIVQMLITPGKQDLQKRMQVREGHITLDKHPAPDEWTNASEDDAELVDTERCGRGCHALRVLQRSVLLKGSPRYLALSNFFADAIAYQRVPGDHPDMYRQIHQRLHDHLVQLRTALGQQDPPLVIIAHSLGSVIMSNYIWDEQTQHGLGTTPLTRMETLAGFVTFGSPLPLFTLALDDVISITFPPPTLPAPLHGHAQWLNFFDADDVLGYPLKPLSPSYAQAVRADLEINVGHLFTAWNPIAHTAYWTEHDFTKPVAQLLRDLVVAQQTGT